MNKFLGFRKSRTSVPSNPESEAQNDKSIFQILNENPYASWYFDKAVGSVRVFENRKRNKKVAIKVYDNASGKRNSYDLFVTELENFKTAGFHPHIVQFICAFLLENREEFGIVLEFCSEISLDKIWCAFEIYTERDVRDIVMQVASALEHLRLRSIVHRDVKPGNILVRSWEPINIALGDFNLSTVGKSNEINAHNFVTSIGTQGYVAPEVLEEVSEAPSSHIGLRKNVGNKFFGKPKRAYSYKCDVYSLGVVAYELLSGRLRPFLLDPVELEGRKKLKSEINPQTKLIEAKALDVNEVRFLPSIAWIGKTAESMNLLKSMLVFKPQDRIDFAGILEHDWNNVDPVKMRKRCYYEDNYSIFKNQVGVEEKESNYASFEGENKS